MEVSSLLPIETSLTEWPSLTWESKDWCGGESIRLSPMNVSQVQISGMDTIYRLSLLFVLSLAPTGFSPGAPVFPFLKIHFFQNSNSTRNQVDEEPLSGCATSKSLLINYLFIYLFICLINYLHPLTTQPTVVFNIF